MSDESKTLISSLDAEDYGKLKDFLKLGESEQEEAIRGCSAEHRTKYLYMLTHLLKKGKDVYDSVKRLLVLSDDLATNDEFRKKVTDCCKLLKKHTIGYNKLIYLRGKIEYLKKNKEKKDLQPKRTIE